MGKGGAARVVVQQGVRKFAPATSMWPSHSSSWGGNGANFATKMPWSNLPPSATHIGAFSSHRRVSAYATSLMISFVVGRVGPSATNSLDTRILQEGRRGGLQPWPRVTVAPWR